jgi:hypothetical protein
MNVEPIVFWEVKKIIAVIKTLSEMFSRATKKSQRSPEFLLNRRTDQF